MMDEETEGLHLRIPASLMRYLEGVAVAKKWTLSRTVRAILREDYYRQHSLAEEKEMQELEVRMRQDAAREAFANK